MIRLLANITYRMPIVVDGKTINFDLGNYDFNLDTSNNPIAVTLTVTNGGKLNLTGTGTGVFNVTGAFCGVEVSGAGSEVTVNNVKTIKPVASRSAMIPCGIGAWSGGKVTILGNITSEGVFGIMANDSIVYVSGNVTANSGSGIEAADSTVTVGGNVTAQNHGVNTYGNSSVKVNGNVRSTYYGSGVTALGNAVVEIGGKITADMSVGVALGNEAKVYVNGTITAGPDAYRITIGGTAVTDHTGIETHNGVNYYVYTNGRAYAYLFESEANDALVGIEVKTMPTKTEYTEGDVLDLAGLVITAKYGDGSSADVTGYITDPVEGAALNTAGTRTVTVTYSERGVTRTTSFDVTVEDLVTAPVLESIRVTTQPDKTIYINGETLDLTGMVITATYTDGSSADVTGYTTDPAEGDVLLNPGTVVTVSYTEDGVTAKAVFYVQTDLPVFLESIAVTEMPSKTVYTVGEALDLTGLVITEKLTDGSTTVVTNYVTDPVDGAILDAVGTITVTVARTVDGVTETATFDVTVEEIVVDPVLESIEVATLPDKIVYTAGDALDLTGLVITAAFSNGSTEETESYITDPANGAILDNAGTVTVTVSYTFFEVTKTATFDVTVEDAPAPEPVLESIEVTTMPSRTVYTVGDRLVLTGLVISAIYDDGSSAEVTGYAADPANGSVLSSEGTITVTVTYTENGMTETASFTITVNGSTSSVSVGVQIVTTIVVVLVLVIFLLRRP
jgi:hypothetical protein